MKLQLAAIASIMFVSAAFAAPAQSATDTTQRCSNLLFCQSDAQEAIERRWQAHSKHPLVARVYNATASLGASDARLTGVNEARLPSNGGAQSQIILLGENHDNAEHHWARALLATKTAAQTLPAAWVFEQFDQAKQSRLDAFARDNAGSDKIASLADFKAALDWAASGWSKYDYDPLLQAALDAKLPMYAGDVTREAIMKTAKSGETAIAADERTRLKLDVPLGAKLDDASLTEIEQSHCGMMPKTALGGMAFAQRYRDAHLADVLHQAAEKHGAAVLFAGNGHVRSDRGVPWYLRQLAPDKTVVSVMLVEVEDGKTDPEAYVPRDPDGKPAADYLVFTPPAKRGDPCDAFKKK